MRHGYYRTSVITPDEFGLVRGTKEELVGGTPAENAEITKAILTGAIEGTKRNAVLLNAGAALFVAGKATSIGEGIALARDIVQSGKAMDTLQKCIAVSNA